MAENKELQEIFDNDEIKGLISKAMEASRKAREPFVDILEPIELKLSELSPEQNEELAAMGVPSTKEDLVTAAEIIGVEPDVLELYLEKSKEVAEATEGIIDYDKLQKEWEELLPNVPVYEMTFETCEVSEPYIVFYSASWCNPCKLRKPMYAQLAPFFDKASLWFTEDEEFAASEGVNRYPTLVAYFAGGVKVKTSLPLSAEELWKTMNTLIDAGKASKSDGTLECTDTECKIEPW